MMNNITKITGNDYCVSCGGCVHICPYQNIKMMFSIQKGKWEASVKDEKKCHLCNGLKNCLQVCPSYNTNYLELAQSNKNHLLGNIENVYTGYSKNPEIRHHRSSGGCITEICLALIENRSVDGIITFGHHEGLDYFPKVFSNVDLMPNSIYHNLNFENAFELIQEREGQFLLIGLPCQITSITTLLRTKKFSALKSRIYATIALICGFVFERVNMEAFAYYKNVELKNITYREDGRYRKTRIANHANSKLFHVYKPGNFLEMVDNSLMTDRYLPQHHCLYCVDHIGYCADIVVGDAWLKRFEKDTTGVNLLISRTPIGETIIQNTTNCVFEKTVKEDVFKAQKHYATGSFGEGMKQMRFSNKTFYPNHIRTDNPKDIVKHKFSFYEKLRITVVKQLLRKRQFKKARLVYILLNLKMLPIYFITKISGHK